MLLFSKDIKLIKSNSKDIYNVKKTFKSMLFYSTFYSSKNPKNKIHQDHVTLKTGVMAAE